MNELSSSKQKIYDSALGLFATKGYSGTSMSDIADAVGIRKATLYSHFKSKEDIFTLILRTIIRKHQKNLTELISRIDKPSAIETLEEIYYSYIDYCRDNTEVDFWTRFYYFPPQGLDSLVHSSTHAYEQVFEKRLLSIIQAGIKSGEIVKLKAHDIMLSYYHLLIGFVMSLNFYKGKDTRPDAKSCISVFLAGIKT